MASVPLIISMCFLLFLPLCDQQTTSFRFPPLFPSLDDDSSSRPLSLLTSTTGRRSRSSAKCDPLPFNLCCLFHGNKSQNLPLVASTLDTFDFIMMVSLSRGKIKPQNTVLLKKRAAIFCSGRNRAHMWVSLFTEHVPRPFSPAVWFPQSCRNPTKTNLRKHIELMDGWNGLENWGSRQ